ncbi:MAG: carbohydrate kinase family protein, partial [Anaerolineae bacterium]|nr:carbohydrate kinase family protein [Anaerolineae bacterium]
YPSEAIVEFTRQSQIIFCNQMELEYLCGVLDMPAAGILDAFSVDTIVITRGKHGSRILTVDAQVDIPALPCAVVDTTGAGDAFTAGFLAGYFKGFSMPICGRLGAVMAAFCLEGIGCQTHLPDWARLQTRYTEHFGEL